MFGVASRHVGGEVEVQQFVVKGSVIGDDGGRCRAYGENLQEAYTVEVELGLENGGVGACLLYTSPSPRDKRQSRMPSSA